MNFSKMQELGHDFVVVDGITQNVYFSPDLIKRLADRHSGIGFDQLIIVEPPYDPDLDFHYRTFNANGCEIAQYGNGARCVARFVKNKGLTNKRELKLSTEKGSILLVFNDNDMITTNMGIPNFEPQGIPFRAVKTEKTYIIRVAEQTILCGVVSLDAPYCILQVDDIETAQVESLGALLETHERFPEQTNVGFMQFIHKNHIRLRLYERGIGETYANNSGACAAVAVGINQGLLDENVTVDLLAGSLSIHWKGHGMPLVINGTATHVYDGFIQL